MRRCLRLCAIRATPPAPLCVQPDMPVKRWPLTGGLSFPALWVIDEECPLASAERFHQLMGQVIKRQLPPELSAPRGSVVVLGGR